MAPVDLFLFRSPAPVLASAVFRYVGYRMVGPPGLHRGFPTTCMPLHISLASPVEVVEHSDPRATPGMYRFSVGGLSDSPTVLRQNGFQEGIGIELSPLSSRAMFDMPAAELHGITVEASTVLGRAGTELWERLAEAGSWEERFAVCDVVLSRVVEERQVKGELASCWESIIATGGRARIDDLSAAVGYSRRHLSRLFRREFGVGLKATARVARFQRAWQLVTKTDPATLGEAALAAGYADQAHFCREVERLAGCSPTELRAGYVPNVQDL